jgi:hypothetical protein
MKTILSACILSVGLFAGAFCIYCGLNNFANKDRYVSVKGLAEREVMADKVIWPMTYNFVENDLTALYDGVERQKNSIVAFLKRNGVTEEEIFIPSPSVVDRYAQSYVPDNVRSRYQASGKIVVTSSDVPKIMSIMTQQAELLKQGVAVENNEWSVQYLYTSLNDLKPSMIEEATRNGRAVAEKFAADAECDLGSIRFANQGQFSITEDSNTPQIKKVRVVTTIDYYLK